MSISQIRKELSKRSDPDRAKASQWFFKTGPGEYGYGDKFLGLRVPQVRELVKMFPNVPLDEISQLLQSEWHEERLLALLMLVRMFKHGDRTAIYRFYFKHSKFINNWDLVDSSAPVIVGGYFQDRSRAPLYLLAKSKTLWERRIAMLAAFHFIKRDDFEDAFKIAEILLSDQQDLIHKAVGWMLREIGKRDRPAEERFLKQHCKKMPRTMLRYAIEKFPEPLRQRYLDL